MKQKPTTTSGELRENLDLDVVPLVVGLLKFLHYYTGLAEMHGVSREPFVDGLVDLTMKGLLRRPSCSSKPSHLPGT